MVLFLLLGTSVAALLASRATEAISPAVLAFHAQSPGMSSQKTEELVAGIRQRFPEIREGAQLELVGDQMPLEFDGTLDRRVVLAIQLYYEELQVVGSNNVNRLATHRCRSLLVQPENEPFVELQLSGDWTKPVVGRVIPAC